ncbi:flagellar biosynthetic protein FliO [Bartonella sp. B12(2025)]
MYAWLSSQIGAFAANITTSFVIFIIATVAITAIVLFLRRSNTGSFSINRKKYPSRLTLCDTIVIDQTRRLVLVRCDDKEHLLLVGGLTDVVVESSVTSTSIIQKRETQPTLKTTKTPSCHNFTEKRSFSVNEREHTQDKNSTSFMNQYVEDSAITAEIEGRQEPSLFIPPASKK